MMKCSELDGDDGCNTVDVLNTLKLFTFKTMSFMLYEFDPQFLNIQKKKKNKTPSVSPGFKKEKHSHHMWYLNLGREKESMGCNGTAQTTEHSSVCFVPRSSGQEKTGANVS